MDYECPSPNKSRKGLFTDGEFLSDTSSREFAIISNDATDVDGNTHSFGKPSYKARQKKDIVAEFSHDDYHHRCSKINGCVRSYVYDWLHQQQPTSRFRVSRSNRAWKHCKSTSKSPEECRCSWCLQSNCGIQSSLHHALPRSCCGFVSTSGEEHHSWCYSRRGRLHYSRWAQFTDYLNNWYSWDSTVRNIDLRQDCL